MIKKNTSGQIICFVMTTIADGSPLTGASPTADRSIDGGAQTGCDGSVAELGKGQYKFSPDDTDVNGDEIGYVFTATGGVSVGFTISTETKKMVDLNDIGIGAAMTLAADAITKLSYDETTCWPLLAEDVGSTYVARTGADGDTLEALSDEIAAVPDAAEVKAEVVEALTDIHLDHVLAVDFDADAPVGNATSFLRQLMEVDSSLVRFTEAAVANAPGATGDASEAKQDEILVDLVDIKGTAFSKDTHSLVNQALPGAEMALVDAALTADKYDLTTAYCITAADAGATLIARVGADGDTLEDLSDEIALISAGDATAAKQDEILVDIVDMKGTAFSKDTHSLVDLALASALSTVDGIVDNINSTCDDILVSTDADLVGDVAALDTIVTAISKLQRADLVVDDGETPWEYLYKDEGTEDVLMTKEMYEIDDTDIEAVTQIVAQLLKP
jgi:hypothetical protein